MSTKNVFAEWSKANLILIWNERVPFHCFHKSYFDILQIQTSMDICSMFMFSKSIVNFDRQVFYSQLKGVVCEIESPNYRQVHNI